MAGSVFFSFTAFVAPIVEEFAWSFTEVSLVSTVRGLEIGVFSFFIGFFVDRFGAKQARKLFYWNNREYVQVRPENCYVTLLKHPKNGVWAFVSNLRPNRQTVTVRLNLEKLELADRKLKVFTVLTTHQMTRTADGPLTVPLGSEDWVYVWIRPTTEKRK